MFDRCAGVRVAFHAVTRNEPDYELIRFAHRMARAGAYCDDDGLLHANSVAGLSLALAVNGTSNARNSRRRIDYMSSCDA
jgi:hypothetical protein